MRTSIVQDYILHEKMAHFNRERIPERVVHAKVQLPLNTVTHDISKYTKGQDSLKLVKETKVLLRFSTVGEKGSADGERPLQLNFIRKMEILWVTTHQFR
jgi:catalase